MILGMYKKRTDHFVEANEMIYGKEEKDRD
jgi:hypothetical protein